MAPREVLITKGGLSAATMRLLAQPPVPLQLSYVEAGTEFPDAACTLQTLTQQVRSVVAGACILGACIDLTIAQTKYETAQDSLMHIVAQQV